MREITFTQALEEALAEEMRRDERVITFATSRNAGLEQHVLGRGLLSAGEIGVIRKGVEADLDAAVAFAERSPFPDPKDLLADMFAD